MENNQSTAKRFENASTDDMIAYIMSTVHGINEADGDNEDADIEDAPQEEDEKSTDSSDDEGWDTDEESEDDNEENNEWDLSELDDDEEDSDEDDSDDSEDDAEGWGDDDEENLDDLDDNESQKADLQATHAELSEEMSVQRESIGDLFEQMFNDLIEPVFRKLEDSNLNIGFDCIKLRTHGLVVVEMSHRNSDAEAEFEINLLANVANGQFLGSEDEDGNTKITDMDDLSLDDLLDILLAVVYE